MLQLNHNQGGAGYEVLDATPTRWVVLLEETLRIGSNSWFFIVIHGSSKAKTPDSDPSDMPAVLLVIPGSDPSEPQALILVNPRQ